MMRQGDRERLLQDHESIGYETIKVLAGLPADTWDNLLRAFFRERLFDNYGFAEITWVLRNASSTAAGAEAGHRHSNDCTPGRTLMTPHSNPDLSFVDGGSPLDPSAPTATPATAAKTPVVPVNPSQDHLGQHPYPCEICGTRFRRDRSRKTHIEKDYSNWDRWKGEKALRPVRDLMQDFQKDGQVNQPTTAKGMLRMILLWPKLHLMNSKGQPLGKSTGTRQLQIFHTVSCALRDSTLDNQWQAGLARCNLAKNDILKVLEQYPFANVDTASGESHMTEVDRLIRHLLHIVLLSEDSPEFPPRMDSLPDGLPPATNAGAAVPPRTDSLPDHPPRETNAGSTVPLRTSSLPKGPPPTDNPNVVTPPTPPPTKPSPRLGEKRSNRGSRVMTPPPQTINLPRGHSEPACPPITRLANSVPRLDLVEQADSGTGMAPPFRPGYQPHHGYQSGQGYQPHHGHQLQGFHPSAPFSQPAPSRPPALDIPSAQPVHTSNFAYPLLSIDTSTDLAQIESNSWNVERDTVFPYNIQITDNQQQHTDNSGGQNGCFDLGDQSAYGDLPSFTYEQCPGAPQLPYDDPYMQAYMASPPHHQGRPA